jgi:hypothetical protein
MKNQSASLDLVVEAALKLGPRTPEWNNAIAFIRSCYACWVLDYDYDRAVTTLNKLNDEEQRALIVWVLTEDDREEERTEL